MKRLIKNETLRLYILPIAILFIGSCITLLIFTYLNYSRNRMDQNHFQALVNESQNKIDEKIKRYDLALRGSLGLFSASNSVEPQEWRKYIKSLNFSKNLSGISSLGVAFSINDRDLEKFKSPQNPQLESPLEIKFLNGIRAKEHFIITYLEPNPWGNNALGIDLASERNRRISAEEARDSGEARATEIVRFIVRQNNNLGFIYYLPVYKNNMPLNTVEERRKAHIGFVFAPFFISDFFGDFFSEITPELDVDIYNNDSIKREAWLYSRDNKAEAEREFSSALNIGNKKFTIAWRRSGNFIHQPQRNDLLLTLFSFLMTLSSGYILYTHKKNHLLAEKLAQRIKSELLETQSALIQSQKMEAIGQLVSGITHDFNNVLGGIIGYASLIKSKLPAENKTTHQIDLIIDHANLGSNLLRDLLTFVRKGKTHKQKISFTDIIQKTKRIIAASIQKNIQLSLELAPDLWEIEADGGQITQVILNLCINARDAMPQGGEIVIGSENYVANDKLNQWGLPPDHYIHAWVKDNGSGISPEIREKIFEAFFTTKSEGKGTGLGLSMVSEIIKNHGGKITLESTVGVGTCFHIFLPTTQRMSDNLYEEATGSGEVSREKLLTNEAPIAAR